MDLPQITDQLVALNRRQAFFYLLGLQLFGILCWMTIDFMLTCKYAYTGPQICFVHALCFCRDCTQVSGYFRVFPWGSGNMLALCRV